jgi:hypothetical protein
LLPQHGPSLSAESVEHELAPLAAKHSRLWLASVERGLQDPDDVVRTWLDAHRTAVLHVDQGYNALRLYTAGGDAGSRDVPLVSEGFRPQQSVASEHGGGVLVGYDLPTREHRPGDRVQLGLYVRPGTAGRTLGVDWLDPEGRVVETSEIDVPPVAEPGAVVRVIAPFDVFAYTAPGRYQVEVWARSPEGGEVEGFRVRLPVGRVTQSRRLPKRAISQALDAELGEGQIRFLGYGLEPADAIRAGERLTVDLHWQALARMETDYTVFVHLVGGYNPETGGPVWAQDDSWPLAGGHPTRRWLPGQVVVDRHALDVPANTPPGRYQVEVGFYNALDGERLSVSDTEHGRIVIGEIKVTD